MTLVIQVLASSNRNSKKKERNEDENLIREEVLRKLNAAKDGKYIFQSDHSVAELG